MGLLPLDIFSFFQRGDRLYTSDSDVYRRRGDRLYTSDSDVYRRRGDRLYTSESDVYRRQSLTYKVGPRAEKGEHNIVQHPLLTGKGNVALLTSTHFQYL